MAQRKLSEISDIGTFDAVPEADRAEQAASVDPDDAPSGDVDPRSVSEGEPIPQSTGVSSGTEDVWQADPADMAEQAIPVPLGDDYDESYADEEEP